MGPLEQPQESREPNVAQKVATLAISPAQSSREEVIATTRNVVAIGEEASLPNRMAPIKMLLPPRLQLRGPDTGMTGT